MRNTEFRMSRKMHRDNAISTSYYHKSIQNIYKFSPKKKLISDLENTDESDDTDVSDDSDDEVSVTATSSRTVQNLTNDDSIEDVAESKNFELPTNSQTSTQSTKSKEKCPYCKKFFSSGGINRHLFYCRKKSAIPLPSDSDSD